MRRPSHLFFETLLLTLNAFRSSSYIHAVCLNRIEPLQHPAHRMLHVTLCLPQPSRSKWINKHKQTKCLMWFNLHITRACIFIHIHTEKRCCHAIHLHKIISVSEWLNNKKKKSSLSFSVNITVSQISRSMSRNSMWFAWTSYKLQLCVTKWFSMAIPTQQKHER